jgi:hypothetical protein
MLSAGILAWKGAVLLPIHGGAEMISFTYLLHSWCSYQHQVLCRRDIVTPRLDLHAPISLPSHHLHRKRLCYFPSEVICCEVIHINTSLAVHAALPLRSRFLLTYSAIHSPSFNVERASFSRWPLWHSSNTWSFPVQQSSKLWCTTPEIWVDWYAELERNAAADDAVSIVSFN